MGAYPKVFVLFVVQPLPSHSVTVFQNVRYLRSRWIADEVSRRGDVTLLWLVKITDISKGPTVFVFEVKQSKENHSSCTAIPVDKSTVMFRNEVKYFPNGSVLNSTRRPSHTCIQTTTASCHIPSSSLFTTRLITCRYWQSSWVNHKWAPHA
jgi:hypothetical protein